MSQNVLVPVAYLFANRSTESRPQATGTVAYTGIPPVSVGSTSTYLYCTLYAVLVMQSPTGIYSYTKGGINQSLVRYEYGTGTVQVGYWYTGISVPLYTPTFILKVGTH